MMRRHPGPVSLTCSATGPLILASSPVIVIMGRRSARAPTSRRSEMGPRLATIGRASVLAAWPVTGDTVIFVSDDAPGGTEVPAGNNWRVLGLTARVGGSTPATARS